MKSFMKITSTLLVFIIIMSLCVFSTYAFSVGDGKFLYDLNSSTKEATIIDYVGTDSDVKVPSAFNGYVVTKIADSAFKNTSIKSIDLPYTLTEVGNNAFENCTSLVECLLPISITDVGTDLFRGCTSIKKVTFNPYVTDLPARTFFGCSSLTTVIFNPAVKYIGASAFYNCTSFSDASILTGIHSLNEFAFYNTALESVEFSENITSIPRSSFKNNRELTTVLIPKNITYIDSTAFMNCDNLTVKCFKNSVAHNFASDKNIPYVLVDPYDLGDVDLSGVVDIKDSTTIQKYLAEIEMLDDTQLTVADFNQDGGINIIDATAIQKYLVS